MPRTIYLARHGRSSAGPVVLGQTDAALSQEGREQAQTLAGELAGRGIERILSSTLKRSSETATILGQSLGIHPESDPRWNEISYGEWDGLSWAQIEARDPERAARKLDDWWGVTPPGGEATNAFVERVSEAWRGWLADPQATTVLVGHLGVNALVRELAQGEIDWVRLTAFQQDYAAMLRLEIE